VTPVPGAPTITFVPKVIDVGSKFSITGLNFTTGSEVNLFVATSGRPINGGPLIPIAHTLPTQLTVNVPASVPLGNGFAEVQVVNTNDGYLTSNSVPALLQGSPTAGIPSLTTINGFGLATTSSNPSYAANNVETVVVPGKVVTLGGTGSILPTAWRWICSATAPGARWAHSLQAWKRIHQYFDKLHVAAQRTQSGDGTGVIRGDQPGH
jgi:hypothetical protein